MSRSTGWRSKAWCAAAASAAAKSPIPTNLEGIHRATVRAAVKYSRQKRGPAVVIARHPCLLDRRQTMPAAPNKARASEHCDGCGFCVQEFECPALALDEAAGTVRVDRALCSGCGVCVQVCAKGGLEMSGDGDGN
jgi:indolepyruvate ferredoxin oxidoreductase, alpha subunit